MRLEVVRLISTDHHGIGDKGNAMMGLIYTYFIQKYELDFYWLIKINQISDETLENIFIEEDKIHIDFLYPIESGFSSYSEEKQNKIRLTIIHEALLLFSEKDQRFSREKLEKIRNEILEKDFNFEIDYINSISPEDLNTSASVSIVPTPNYFDTYLILRKGTEEQYRVKIFRGKPTDYYIDMFFSTSHWKDRNEFIVSGPEEEVEFHLRLDTMELRFENLTPFAKPPLWEMMMLQQNEEAERSAYENWLYSLPPGYAAIVRNAQN